MPVNTLERVSRCDSRPAPSANPGGKHIVFVRHGETDFNAAKRYQGCLDTPVLTELGCRQASETGKLLARVSFDAVYFSPLRRARQTMEGILKQLEAPPGPICSGELRELDLPNWQGVPLARVQSEFGADYRAWKEDPDEYVMRTATGPFAPLADVDKRASRFLDRIARAGGERTVLVISHGGTIRAMVRAALGLPAKFHHRQEQFNGGLTWLQLASDGQAPRIRMLNDCRRLVPGNRLQGTRIHLIPRPIASADRVEKMSREVNADAVVHAHDEPHDLGADTIRVGSDSVRDWIGKIQSIHSSFGGGSRELLAVATPEVILGMISQVAGGSERFLSKSAIDTASSFTRFFLPATETQMRLESVCPIRHPFTNELSRP